MGAGAARDRITFQKRGADDNGDPLGPWEDDFTVSAELIWLRGSEAVLQARLQGLQPVVIRVRKEARTTALDNAWRAVNARDVSQVFSIQNKTPTKGDLGRFDILAQMGGSDA